MRTLITDERALDRAKARLGDSTLSPLSCNQPDNTLLASTGWPSEVTEEAERSVEPLRQLNNLATHVIGSVSRIGLQPCWAAPIHLLRDIVVATDAIQYLAGSLQIPACQSLLRQAYETSLKSLHTLSDLDGFFGTAYRYDHYWSERRRIINWIECNVRGRTATGLDEPEKVQHERQILEARKRQIEETMGIPEFASMEKEFELESMNRNRSRPKIRWWQLRNGPDGVLELARLHSVESAYDVLYRDWSQFIHGGAAMDSRLFVNGQQGMLPIRNPEQLHGTITVASACILKPMFRLLEVCAKDLLAEVGRLYQQQVAPSLRRVHRHPGMNVKFT